jgi:hypothetical protein
MIATVIVTGEVEAVGGLLAAREVSHAPPELFDVFERRHFIVEVVSHHLGPHARRIHPAIKDLPSGIEFE